MRFLTVRDLRSNSAQVWRDLSLEREMVITSHGRPIAVLTATDESDVEESLKAWRQVRAARAIAALQQESSRKGKNRISVEEIDAEIRKSRMARRKRPA